MPGASFKRAVQWIAANEDTSDLEGDDPAEWAPSISMSMVADLWDKSPLDVMHAVRRELGLKRPKPSGPPARLD